jgi:hypothetical protein
VDGHAPVDRPELLDSLSHAMALFAFDERTFLTILFTSRFYPSESIRGEWMLRDLRGPWLRDSVLVLLVEDSEECRKSAAVRPYDFRSVVSHEAWQYDSRQVMASGRSRQGIRSAELQASRA